VLCGLNERRIPSTTAMRTGARGAMEPCTGTTTG